MWNKFLSVFLGAFAGLLCIGGLEQLVHLLYPSNLSKEVDDPAQVADMIRHMPVGAFVSLLLVYLVSSFAGGLLAAVIAQENKTRRALSVGVIILAGGIANFWMIPHPLWFVCCSLLVYLPAAYIGGMLGARFSKPKLTHG